MRMATAGFPQGRAYRWWAGLRGFRGLAAASAAAACESEVGINRPCFSHVISAFITFFLNKSTENLLLGIFSQGASVSYS